MEGVKRVWRRENDCSWHNWARFPRGARRDLGIKPLKDLEEQKEKLNVDRVKDVGTLQGGVRGG